MAGPEFSDAQKTVIWTALQQFVDNCEEDVALHQEAPDQYPMPKGYQDAVEALDKLDAWMANRLIAADEAADEAADLDLSRRKPRSSGRG